MTAIDRRGFLSGLSAVGLLPGGPVFAAAHAETRYLTSFKRDGRYFAALLGGEGQLVRAFPLPARAHDTVISPDGGTAVVLGRRPGTQALVLDLTTARVAGTVTVRPDRRLYGHGFFSADGRYLYLTENDFDQEHGVIGIYDAADRFRRIDERPTHGIGPHQALLLRDGKSIAVANGGILTHPDFGRQKLNLAEMQPNLTYLDLVSGAMTEQVSLPRDMHQMSLRHLTEDGSGTVWLGGQFQGGTAEELPLVFTHRRGEPLRAAATPQGTYHGFKHYIGSVVASADGDQVAASSPRGGQVLIFDAAERRLITRFSAEDVCGLAANGDGFLASDGRGRLWRREALVRIEPGVAWDNHISRRPIL